MPETYFTTKEVADLLKVTDYTVRQLIDRGDLQASKVGKSWRVSDVSINNYMEKQSNLKGDI